MCKGGGGGGGERCSPPPSALSGTASVQPRYSACGRAGSSRGPLAPAFPRLPSERANRPIDRGPSAARPLPVCSCLLLLSAARSLPVCSDRACADRYGAPPSARAERRKPRWRAECLAPERGRQDLVLHVDEGHVRRPQLRLRRPDPPPPPPVSPRSIRSRRSEGAAWVNSCPGARTRSGEWGAEGGTGPGQTGSRRRPRRVCPPAAVPPPGARHHDIGSLDRRCAGAWTLAQGAPWHRPWRRSRRR